MQINIVEPIVQLLGIGVTFSGSASLTAETNLVADATTINTPVYLTVESNLQANAILNLNAASVLTAESNLTSLSVIGLVASASLTFESSLTVQPNIVSIVVSITTGESNLTAVASLVEYVSIDLYGDSHLDALEISLINLTGRPFSGESRLTATMFQPLNILNLPVVEYEYTNDRLMKFYGIDSGQSLIITGTVGKIVEFQTGTEIEDADYYFGGGRRHVLTDNEVTAVQNAGFGNLITIEGVPSGV